MTLSKAEKSLNFYPTYILLVMMSNDREKYLSWKDIIMSEWSYIIISFLSSPLPGKRDIVVTIFVRCMCVHPCVCVSVRICPDHNLYNNAWISKQFGTVVALKEEKCHLKHS